MNKNTMRINNSRKSINIYLFGGGSLIVIIAILSITVFAAYKWLPAKVHYHITKTFQFSQETGGANIYLGLILPKSGPNQSVNNLLVQWDGSQEKRSLAYIDTLKLWDQIPGEGERAAIVEYDIILPQGEASWQAPVEKHHLLPQEGIESDHSEIKKTISWLTDGSEVDDAFKIFRFTIDHLEYTADGCEETNISALEAYRTGMGACIGYSRLMVALCRASGIPARMIIGTILPDILFSLPQVISSGTPGGGHAWVEYNSQDKWYMADPSWGTGYSARLAFNRNDGRHLSFGEFDQFTAAKRDLIIWSTQQASPIDDTLTYVFAADSDQAAISSETTVRKTWDGRWLNTLVALAVVTFLLCMIRDRVISKLIPEAPAED